MSADNFFVWDEDVREALPGTAAESSAFLWRHVVWKGVNLDGARAMKYRECLAVQATEEKTTRNLRAPTESRCYCVYECELPFTYVGAIPLGGERGQTLRVVIDEDGSVEEWDEDNNALLVHFGPTGTEPRTWGSVKAMYH